MKQLLTIALLAIASQPVFADGPTTPSACQNLMSTQWTASTIGLNDAREMRLGTGTARVTGKNKIRVDLIENSPLGVQGYAAVIEFTNGCHGRTDAGVDVYLNIHCGGKHATLLWLDANEVRKAEMEAE